MTHPTPINKILQSQNAQAAGAAGLIVINTDDVRVLMQAPDAETNTLRDFPAVLVPYSSGSRLRTTAMGTTAVLHEDQLREEAAWTYQNVYVSDISGTKFTLSLKNVQYSPDLDVRIRPTVISRRGNFLILTIATLPSSLLLSQLADVARIDSMPGTYVANALDPKTNNLVSVITYNKGATWWPLTPPDNARCDGDNCALHLALEHAEFTGVPLPVSVSTAPGIILVHGVLGTSVIDDYEQVRPTQ